MPGHDEAHLGADVGVEGAEHVVLGVDVEGAIAPQVLGERPPQILARVAAHEPVAGESEDAEQLVAPAQSDDLGGAETRAEVPPRALQPGQPFRRRLGPARLRRRRLRPALHAALDEQRERAIPVLRHLGPAQEAAEARLVARMAQRHLGELEQRRVKAIRQRQEHARHRERLGLEQIDERVKRA